MTVGKLETSCNHDTIVAVGACDGSADMSGDCHMISLSCLYMKGKVVCVLTRRCCCVSSC